MMEHSVIFPDHRKVCALGQGTWKMGKSALREADEIDALRAGIELGKLTAQDIDAAAIPDLVLRTSIIVGFPGEGEAEFENLCRELPPLDFQRAGVFPFSCEEGTPAADMPDQVPGETARHRAELLAELQSRVMDRWNESRLGTVMEVLCEGFDADEGCWVGRTYADSPDIDGHVYFTAAGTVPAGTFVNVRITGTSDGDLTGEIEE